MLYHLTRRTRGLPDSGEPQHTRIGLSSELDAARSILVDVLTEEVMWLHAEHTELGGQWRIDRARRLERAAELVADFTDGVYRSVEVDGVQYGWVRTAS